MNKDKTFKLIMAANEIVDIWLNCLKGYTYQELIIKPDKHDWSMGQLYNHLINETNWYLDQIDVCLKQLDHIEKDMSQEGKIFFENNALPDIRIIGDQKNASKVLQPESLSQLISDFKALKNRMNAVWLNIQSNKIYGKSLHPGFQYLDPLEWFQFSEIHMRHHLRQKARIDQFLGGR